MHTGDLITIGMLDLEGVRMFFSTGIVRMVLLTMLIGIGSYLLISTDVTLGLLSLSFVPFVAWRSSMTHLRLRATWLQLQERLSILTRVMEENLGGIRVVRAFASQAHELGKFDRASQLRARSHPRPHRHPGHQHLDHVAVVLRRDGAGAVVRREPRCWRAKSPSAR